MSDMSAAPGDPQTEPSEKEEEATRQSSRSPSPPLGDYDRDLLAQLPQLTTIEQLFEYYFSYCKWIFRRVSAFQHSYDLIC
jgi:hypothetical protein